jgi:hypothetical protein
MSWEWSPGNEGGDTAYDNLHAQDREFLTVAYAECMAAYQEGIRTELDSAAYDQHLQEAADLANYTLADAIWDHAVEIRTCDNGGHRAWVCPFGCHTVNIDEVEDEEEE